MAGTPLKNLRMFEELCGKNAFKNVILTTTMWDEVDEDTGVTREEELRGIYWKAMIDRGSSTGRFKGTRDSAFCLIAPLLDEANTRNKLLLQKELVDLDLRLSETHAGQKLRSEIKQLAKQQQELLHQIREELKRPNNATSLQSLMEEYEELKKTSGSLLTQMADLQVPLGRQFMNAVTITFGIKRNRYVYKILISSTQIRSFVPPGQRMPLPPRKRGLLSSKQRMPLPSPRQVVLSWRQKMPLPTRQRVRLSPTRRQWTRQWVRLSPRQKMPLLRKRTMLDNARQTNYCYKEFQQFCIFHFF
jgi:hypothetical protein